MLLFLRKSQIKVNIVIIIYFYISSWHVYLNNIRVFFSVLHKKKIIMHPKYCIYNVSTHFSGNKFFIQILAPHYIGNTAQQSLAQLSSRMEETVYNFSWMYETSS